MQLNTNVIICEYCMPVYIAVTKVVTQWCHVYIVTAGL